MDIEIRKAEPDELDRVARFYDDVIDSIGPDEPGPKWTKGVYPTVEEMSAAIEAGTLYVAELPDVAGLAGCMVLNADADDVYYTHPFKSGISQDDAMVIHLLAVSAECRGKGVAREMVEFAKQAAVAQKAKALRLDVMEGNTPAFGLYEACGFENAGVATLYYEDTGWADFTLYEFVLERDRMRQLNAAGWVLSLVPLVVGAVAWAVAPEIVPTHLNWALEGDAWGPKSILLVLAVVLTAVNILCAVCMSNTEKFMKMGLVHGVKTPRTARIVLFVSIVLVDVIDIVITAAQLAAKAPLP